MISSPSLLIAAAVPAELAIIQHHMSGKKIVRRGPIELQTGSINGRDLATVISGPGTVNMAGALGAAFTLQPPELVMVTGCGGAFGGSGMSPGDLAFATEEIHGQLGMETEEATGPAHSLPFLQNRYALDQVLVKNASSALKKGTYATRNEVFKGPFLTVSTVTSRVKTAAEYEQEYRAIVENMEGFAAAAICKQYDIPLLELRAVSNMVGQTDRASWRLDFAFERAQEAVLHLLKQGII